MPKKRHNHACQSHEYSMKTLWYGTNMHTYIHTCLLLLISTSDFRIERRQVVFLCWMQDSNQGLWNRISSRLNARWQTDWAIEDPAEKLNSVARPYDQRAFSPLFEPWKSETPNRQQTECPLTKLSRIKLKLELYSPTLWWASFQPTWLHCWLAFDTHKCMHA